MTAIKWLPFELHTHTWHSDGAQSLMELCSKARELGLAGIALTDHNTISGHEEIKEAEQQTGIVVIPGVEWTTFYGHMLTLGAGYCEWRDLGKREIGRGIERVHEAGGLAGVAHPYQLGSPFCTGCWWDYEISDWREPDYLEVWHGLNPHLQASNEDAFRLWTGKLNDGCHLAATSGWDWHRGTASEESPPAVTYLGVSGELSAASALSAIANGRMSVSMGPCLEVIARAAEGEMYYSGDELPHGLVDRTIQLSISLLTSSVTHAQQISGERHVLIETNTGTIARLSLDTIKTDATAVDVPIVIQQDWLWLRVLLMEDEQSGQGERMLAFANPLYFAPAIIT